jgi:ferredoxin
MKLQVNLNRCMGHARCFGLAPELFPLDDAGFPVVGDGEVPEHLATAARRARENCPEDAISILDDPDEA